MLSKLLKTFDAEVLELEHVASWLKFKHLAATTGIAMCVSLTRRIFLELNLHRVGQLTVMLAPDRANNLR
jgi:hypothetical protein